MAYSFAQTHKLKFITINIVYLLCCYTETAQSKTVIPQCKSKNYFEKYSDINLAKCKQDRSSSVCKKLENSIKQNGIDPETKLKQCDINGAKKEFAFEYIPFVSTVSCLNGLANFGISSVANIGRMIGEFAGAIKVDFDKSKERSDQCNSSIDNKIALYKAFNISTPKLMNINIPSKDSINNKQCWQIENDLREHGRLQQKKLEFSLNPRGLTGQFDQMTADEKNFWQWSHPEISNGSGHTDLLKTAKEILVQKGLELDCYSSYTAQALVCEAMTEAATLLLGFQSGIKRLSQASKIPEIAGVSKVSKKIYSELALSEMKNTKLLQFMYRYDIDTEPILLNGVEYLRIIPNKNGHWLARQAEVYKRKYNTDFVIASEKDLAAKSPAEFETINTSNANYSFLKISSKLNLDNMTDAMSVLAHEYVHIRNQSAATGLASLNTEPPIVIFSNKSKIPIPGYQDMTGTDEIEAYSRSLEVYKRGLVQAQQIGDSKNINKYSNLIKDTKEQIVANHNFTDQSLTNAKSAAEKFDLYDKPIKEYGYVRTTIITYDNAGNKFPVVLEFPANTPTDPKKFKQILLDRIQREIDKNRKIVQGL